MTSKDAGDAYNDRSSEEHQGAAAANPDDLRILEALLFASEELMTAARLKAILPNNPDARRIRSMAEKINVQLQKERHPFEIVEIGGGYQFRTITYYHPWVRQIFKEKAVKKLSIQALECLAIIAYKQPLSKAEIEAIRGVVSDGAMKTLLEKRLITIAGRSDKPGRPLLYATTQSFLKYFGLNKIEDLPRIEEFESIAREKMEEMSLDELNEPDLEVEATEEQAEEIPEVSVEGGESSGQSDGMEVSDSSVFEVSIDETETPEGTTDEGAEKEEEVAEPTTVESKDGADERHEKADVQGDMVTDKTQAMVRESVVPPVKKKGHWVKGAEDLQEIDMGKTKAFSDSVFDLDLQKSAKQETEEDIRVAEAETITMKAIEDEEVQSGEYESEDEETFEVSDSAEETPQESAGGDQTKIDETETEDGEADFEVTGTVSASAEEPSRRDEEKGDTAETEVDEAFDIEALTSAIEEVKPEEMDSADKKTDKASSADDGGSEILPEPEESAFTIEVTMNESDVKSAENNGDTDDDVASFEVGATAGKEIEDTDRKEASPQNNEKDEPATSPGAKTTRKPAKGKKGGKKKGK